jgi:hypothetical protein
MTKIKLPTFCLLRKYFGKTKNNNTRKRDTAQTTNDRREFLLVLSRSALCHFSGCLGHFCSSVAVTKPRNDEVVQIAKRYSRGLRGRLHVCIIDDDDESSNNKEESPDKCECCSAGFSVRGVLETGVLYGLLPKEKVYVPIESWYDEHMRSQMMELMYILGRVGATSVHLQLEKSDSNASSLGLDASATAAAMIPVGVQGIMASLEASSGFKYDKVSETHNAIELKATYDPSGGSAASSSLPPLKTVADLLSDPRVYYLSKRHDWQDLVTERLAFGAKESSFAFEIKNLMSIDSGVVSRMQGIGVDLRRSKKDSGRINIVGRIQY